MKIGSCFSGVGAMDLGVAKFFSASTAWFIEREKYPRKILERHWPGVPIYGDIATIDPADLEPVDIMIGGPPCTDLSVAGKRAGLYGEKSRLFFDMVNIAAVVKPKYVMIENSPVLLDKWRGTVEGAFADVGYGVTWARLSAAHVGAPHLRWRCFLLAELGAVHSGVCFPPSLPKIGLWPTPSASMFNDGENVGQWLDRRTLVKLSTGNGNGFGVPLGIAVRWPTPAANSGDQHALNPTPRMTGGTTLGGAVRWATPVASDTKDRGTMGRTPAIARRVEIGKQITLSMQTDGSRLSPDWVETLQGLPINWTALDGDTDPRPWPMHRVDGMWGDSPQFAHEPPRLCDPKSTPNRRARLKCLGNLNPPAVYAMALDMMLRGPRQVEMFTGKTTIKDENER